MKSSVLSFVFVASLMISLPWQKDSLGFRENAINCIAVHPQDQELIFVGTSKALYRSQNAGRYFQPVLQMHSSRRAVNHIYIDEHNAETVLAATDDGIFLSANRGNRWEKIYDADDESERKCYSILSDGEFLYAATAGGLLYKTYDMPIWFKMAGELGDAAIYDLAKDARYIYAAGPDVLYREDRATKAVKKIFVTASGQQNGNGEVADADAQDGVLYARKIKDLVVLKDPSRIFLACEDGIFESRDSGESWQKMFQDGLPAEKITAIVINPAPQGVRGGPEKQGSSHGTEAFGSTDVATQPAEGFLVFAGTSDGAYVWQNNRWRSIYKGMETSDVRCLTPGVDGKLYAGTDKGIFFMDAAKALADEAEISDQRSVIRDKASEISKIVGASRDTSDDSRFTMKNFSNEPSIQNVHQWAIDYADVNPDKIKDWRTRAKKKAWLPSVSVGLANDKNLTIGDSVYGTYTSGGQHYVGPDDKTFYDNFGWDVSLSWDFGDLVWNSDETSIDSRSKLMVELREDVLDQVTRLYFERRRVQTELLNSGDDADGQMLFDQKMRIDELTAMIDALTGGEFSKRLANESEGL